MNSLLADLLEYALRLSPAYVALSCVVFFLLSVLGLTIGTLPAKLSEIPSKIAAKLAEKTIDALFSIFLGLTAVPLLVLFILIAVNRSFVQQKLDEIRGRERFEQALVLSIQDLERQIADSRKRESEAGTRVAKLEQEAETRRLEAERQRNQSEFNTLQSASRPGAGYQGPTIEYPICPSNAASPWFYAQDARLGEMVLYCSSNFFLALQCRDGRPRLISGREWQFWRIKYYQKKSYYEHLDQLMTTLQTEFVNTHPLSPSAYQYILDADEARLIGMPRNVALDLAGIKRLSRNFLSCPAT